MVIRKRSTRIISNQSIWLNDNGIFYQSGIILGTWSYNKKNKVINQIAERQDAKELEGKADVISINKTRGLSAGFLLKVRSVSEYPFFNSSQDLLLLDR